MIKQYLIQIFQQDKKFLKEAKEGDIIDFDMPPFCSGDYTAKIYKDNNGLYIKKEDNYLSGCRDYVLINKN